MVIQSLSVVIPVFNEQENVAKLAEEVNTALEGRLQFELIFVNDASSDATAQRIEELKKKLLTTELVNHKKNRGQSAAVITGVKKAKYEWIATLDGDGQNAPADLLNLVKAINQLGKARVLCMGQRVKRKDTWVRKLSSKVANRVRRGFLKDDCPDSGCGIKIFPKPLFLSLPLFKNCHRFLPVLFKRAGVTILQVEVSHRPRVAGQSKYGIMNRLGAGLVDLLGVAWLMRRFIESEGDENV